MSDSDFLQSLASVGDKFIHSPFWGAPTGDEHCEGSYTHTRYIAEFWSAAASLVFLVGGVFSFVKARKARVGPDERWEVMYAIFAVCGLFSFCSHATLNYSMERIDEALYNAACLLLAYLSFEDIYLVLFYQIHVLVTSVLILQYPFVFHIHIIPVVCFLLYRIVYIYLSDNLLNRQAPTFYVGIFTVILLSFTVLFWVLERQYCEPMKSFFIPSPHSLSQLCGFWSFYLSIFLVQYVFAKQPQSRTNHQYLVGWFVVIPYVYRKEKSNK